MPKWRTVARGASWVGPTLAQRIQSAAYDLYQACELAAVAADLELANDLDLIAKKLNEAGQSGPLACEGEKVSVARLVDRAEKVLESVAKNARKTSSHHAVAKTANLALKELLSRHPSLSPRAPRLEE